jgi:hypothetical protein
MACDAKLRLVITDATTDEHRCPGHHDNVHTQTAPAAPLMASPARGTTAFPGVRHGCGCPVTPYVHVLDVGREQRLATPEQRLQVLVSQGFQCAAPGCDNRHLQVHHMREWLADDGPTDIENLVGLCTGCHTLIHRGLLRCTPDGHGGATFATGTGDTIPDIRRRVLADVARNLGDLVCAGILDQHRTTRTPPAPSPPGARPPGTPRHHTPDTPPF